MRIAVVGAGQFGRKHIETVRNEPRCELVAVADPVYNGEKAFSDYRQMLDQVKPDGVIIATPNALHVPVALACIERRVPVLVEKPIADTVSAADELVTAAARARVPLLVGHHRRHNPIVERAREIVQGGGIGRLVAVAALWLLQKPDDYFDVGAWRREAGGGPLLINCIHDVDGLRYICGEIAEVRALTSSHVRKFQVEDTAAIALRFADGALGTITLSDTAAAPWAWEVTSGEYAFYPEHQENCYYFAGTEGSLAFPHLQRWSYRGEKGWTTPLAVQAIAVEEADSQARQLRHFCRVIRGEEAPRSSGADATRTLEVVEMIRRAAS